MPQSSQRKTDGLLCESFKLPQSSIFKISQQSNIPIIINPASKDLLKGN
ncbi:MAG: hypothetical protein HN647_04055 [Candidatus Marinimicrobia bacterium]|jgi:hypothetical protein|nr:hypothetical protein [Candidatus Neomarinimicrobiota bacterium]MBT7985731.1 hypothetical protein [Candidatus Neomarinimicrobiota bacterium]